MSKKGAPRKSFTSFVQESKADTIDVPDDDGNTLISIPQPHFWTKEAKAHATAENGPGMFRTLCGDEAYDRFVEHCAGIGLDEDQAAATLMAWMMEELGGDLGESSASSTS